MPKAITIDELFEKIDVALAQVQRTHRQYEGCMRAVDGLLWAVTNGGRPDLDQFRTQHSALVEALAAGHDIELTLQRVREGISDARQQLREIESPERQ